MSKYNLPQYSIYLWSLFLVTSSHDHITEHFRSGISQIEYRCFWLFFFLIKEAVTNMLSNPTISYVCSSIFINWKCFKFKYLWKEKFTWPPDFHSQPFVFFYLVLSILLVFIISLSMKLVSLIITTVNHSSFLHMLWPFFSTRQGLMELMFELVSPI